MREAHRVLHRYVTGLPCKSDECNKIEIKVELNLDEDFLTLLDGNLGFLNR